MVALLGVTLLTAVGSGIDLGRSYLARQQLSNAAALTCQYANRPSVTALAFGSGAGSGGGAAAYRSAVATFLNASLAAQNIAWPLKTTTPFSYVPNGSADVSLSVDVPTTILTVIGIESVAATATAHCFDLIAPLAITPVPDASTTLLVNESFENSACTGTCYVFYSIAGEANQTRYTPQNTPGGTAGYVGASGTQWIITGYCLEVDAVGVIRGTVPDGSHSAELDCDNGRNAAGNSSISTKVYLQVGTYELRWSYASRVYFRNYDPVYICGSVPADTVWATDAVSDLGTGPRSNQINVYFDRAAASLPPTHATMDGTQLLAGANLIDHCVNSVNWVQRSVPITVTTAGFYWLSFAADGINESFGGQVDHILLCSTRCAGAVQDNFPPQWLPANNAGQERQLFRETFEGPAQATPPCGRCGYVLADLDRSTGDTGTAASGWPNQIASGWVTSPYDQAEIFRTGSGQGAQSVGLAGTAWAQGATTRRTLSRKLLLDPGYYRIEYIYIGNTPHQGVTGAHCAAAPTSAAVLQFAQAGSGPAVDRITGDALTAPFADDLVAVLMSNAQLVSGPSGSAQRPIASYANPDGTVTATAAVPLDRVDLQRYDPAQVNPLIDICHDATGWQARKTFVRIIKPGQYWLAFAGLGTDDARAGAIDDVRVTALGSLAMQSPPSGAVTIPVPDPQPGATLSFAGFSITTGQSP